MDNSSRPERQLAFVIPARNEEHYLRAALDSVAAQRFPPDQLEAVVVENGSRDATLEVARGYAAAAPRLAIRVVSEPVAGIARAKNRGAREASAGTRIFLDADSRAAENLASAVSGWIARGYPAGSIPIVADSSDWLDRGFFGLIEWGKGLFKIHAQMLYCQRALFLDTGGFGESLQLAEDREFLTLWNTRASQSAMSAIRSSPPHPPAACLATAAGPGLHLRPVDARPREHRPPLALLIGELP